MLSAVSIFYLFIPYKAPNNKHKLTFPLWQLKAIIGFYLGVLGIKGSEFYSLFIIPWFTSIKLKSRMQRDKM